MAEREYTTDTPSGETLTWGIAEYWTTGGKHHDGPPRDLADAEELTYYYRDAEGDKQYFSFREPYPGAGFVYDDLEQDVIADYEWYE